MLRLAANFGTPRAPVVCRRRGGRLLLPLGPVNTRPTAGEDAMGRWQRALGAVMAVVLLAGGAAAARAQEKEPIKIGFSMELTGPFAVVGKTGLLAFKIWEEEVNAEGGLLGRPVKLVYYDDQSNPSLVPGIYTKLIDIDKVDLLVSSYGTNLVVPAMPVAISYNRLFFGLFALAANEK